MTSCLSLLKHLQYASLNQNIVDSLSTSHIGRKQIILPQMNILRNLRNGPRKTSSMLDNLYIQIDIIKTGTNQVEKHKKDKKTKKQKKSNSTLCNYQKKKRSDVPLKKEKVGKRKRTKMSTTVMIFHFQLTPKLRRIRRNYQNS